jgi:uncharacterized membrane protein
MTESNGSLSLVFIIVVLMAVLLGIGLLLRRRGVLRGRQAWLIWCLIVIAPAVGGWFLYTAKTVEQTV